MWGTLISFNRMVGIKTLLEWVEGILGGEVDMGNIGHSCKEFYYKGSREVELWLEGGWRNCKQKKITIFLMI